MSNTEVRQPVHGWIQTYTGRQFFLAEPKAEDISIQDIAAGLARTCRFGGHCRLFYSVAQHSVSVSRMCEGAGQRVQLAALLHDAAEAYIGDIVRPLKRLVPEFRKIEERIQRSVAERFGLAFEDFCDPRIKHADNVMLATERRDLMAEPPWPWHDLPEPREGEVGPLDSEFARKLFLHDFETLTFS